MKGAWLAGKGPAGLGGWRPRWPQAWKLAIRTGLGRAWVELEAYFWKMGIDASVTSNK